MRKVLYDAAGEGTMQLLSSAGVLGDASKRDMLKPARKVVLPREVFAEVAPDSYSDGATSPIRNYFSSATVLIVVNTSLLFSCCVTLSLSFPSYATKIFCFISFRLRSCRNFALAFFPCPELCLRVLVQRELKALRSLFSNRQFFVRPLEKYGPRTIETIYSQILSCLCFVEFSTCEV